MDTSCHRSTCLAPNSHFCHEKITNSMKFTKTEAPNVGQLFLQLFSMQSMRTKYYFDGKITFFQKIVHEQPTHHLEIYTGKNNSLTVWPTRKPMLYSWCAASGDWRQRMQSTPGDICRLSGVWRFELRIDPCSLFAVSIAKYATKYGEVDWMFFIRYLRCMQNVYDMIHQILLCVFRIVESIYKCEVW